MFFTRVRIDSRYLRCTIEESEEHEEAVGLREGRGDDAEGVHKRDDDEDLLAAKTVGDAAPEVGAHHHADEDDRVQPALGLRVQIQVTFRRRQDEGHRDDVHLLRGADQSADGQQYIMELAIAAQFDGPLEVGDYRGGGFRQGDGLLSALAGLAPLAAAIAGWPMTPVTPVIGGVPLYVLLLAIAGMAIGLVAAIVRRKLILRLLGSGAQGVRLDDRSVVDVRGRVSGGWGVDLASGMVACLVACCALVVVWL